MKYSIAQITSDRDLIRQYMKIHARVSSFESESLADTLLKCHELNQKWMATHHKNNGGVVLIHVPIEI